MQPLSQRNSPMERFLTANNKAASVLVLFFVILISACQKKMDVINDQSPLSQKRIEGAEIKYPPLFNKYFVKNQILPDEHSET